MGGGGLRKGDSCIIASNFRCDLCNGSGVHYIIHILHSQSVSRIRVQAMTRIKAQVVTRIKAQSAQQQS